jgi:hypothetical protein
MSEWWYRTYNLIFNYNLCLKIEMQDHYEIGNIVYAEGNTMEYLGKGWYLII